MVAGQLTVGICADYIGVEDALLSGEDGSFEMHEAFASACMMSQRQSKVSLLANSLFSHRQKVQQLKGLRPAADLSFFEKALVYLIHFSGFRAILMLLATWARFFKSVWCRNYPKIRFGVRCLKILACRNQFLFKLDLLKTNYSIPLRQPCPNLA